MSNRLRRPHDNDPIERGRGPEDDVDMTFVQTRVEDRSFWFRLAYLQQKYSILMVPIVIVLSVGAKQWVRDTMKETTADMQKQIAALKDDRDALNLKIDILLRVTCISSRATKEELALAGLNCTNLAPIRPLVP